MAEGQACPLHWLEDAHSPQQLVDERAPPAGRMTGFQLLLSLIPASLEQQGRGQAYCWTSLWMGGL